MESLPITIDLNTALTIGFHLLLISYIIFSIILYYHWNNYSVNLKVTKQTYFAFFAISIPLLIIMAVILFL